MTKSRQEYLLAMSDEEKHIREVVAFYKKELKACKQVLTYWYSDTSNYSEKHGIWYRPYNTITYTRMVKRMLKESRKLLQMQVEYQRVMDMVL